MTFFKSYWDEKLIDKIFTTETEEKEEEIFNATHLKINRIKIEKTSSKMVKYFGKSNNEYIPEDILFDYIKNVEPDESRRLIVIKGEVGSGKSELAEAIRYKFHSDSKIVPIIFPRSKVNLKDIFDEINKKFNVQLSFKSLIANYNTKTIATYIINHIQMYLEDREKNHLKPDLIKNRNSLKILHHLSSKDDWFISFRGALIECIDSYREKVKNQGDMKVKFPIVSALEKMILNIFTQYNKNSKVFDEIKNDISIVISNIIYEYQEIPSFQEIIEEIYYKIGKKKRILLIFEDATGFGFAEKLVNFAFDKSLKPCDLIIGWTTGYIEKNNLEADNYRQRTNITLSLSDTSKSFFLTNPNNIILLGKNYLRCLKNLSEPIVSIEKKEELKEIEEFFDNGFYPFNKNSLIRIFNRLEEDGQPNKTPRNFLTHALKDILVSNNFPEDDKAYMKIPQGLFSQDLENKYPDFFSIAYFYGDFNKNKESYSLKIERQILMNLGIELKNELLTDLQLRNISIERDFIKIPVIQPLENWKRKTKTKSNLTESKIIEDRLSDKEPIITKFTENDKTFLKAKRNFHDWLNHGKKLVYQKDLEKGLKIILKHYFKSFFNDMNIFYDKIFLNIKKTVDRTKRGEILLDIPVNSEIQKNIVETALEIGIKKEDFISYIQTSFKNVNIAILQYWIEERKKEFLGKMDQKISAKLGLKYTQFILILRLYSIVIISCKKEIPMELLFKFDIKSKLREIKETFLDKCPVCKKKIQNFYCHSHGILNPLLIKLIDKNVENHLLYIQNIFENTFELTSDFIDFEKLKSSIESLKLRVDKQKILIDKRFISILEKTKEVSDSHIIIRSSLGDISLGELSSSFKSCFNNFKNTVYNDFGFKNRFINPSIQSLKFYNDFSFCKNKMNEIKEKINKIEDINGINIDFYLPLEKIINNKLFSRSKDLIQYLKHLKENKTSGNNLFKINFIFYEIYEFWSEFGDFYLEFKKFKNIIRKLENSKRKIISSNDEVKKFQERLEEEKLSLTKNIIALGGILND